MGDLHWYCYDCLNCEEAQPEYEHGDSEPCCLCENGVARVMSLKEAAAAGQRYALTGNARPDTSSPGDTEPRTPRSSPKTKG